MKMKKYVAALMLLCAALFAMPTGAMAADLVLNGMDSTGKFSSAVLNSLDSNDKYMIVTGAKIDTAPSSDGFAAMTKYSGKNFFVYDVEGKSAETVQEFIRTIPFGTDYETYARIAFVENAPQGEINYSIATRHYYRFVQDQRNLYTKGEDGVYTLLGAYGPTWNRAWTNAANSTALFERQGYLAAIEYNQDVSSAALASEGVSSIVVLESEFVESLINDQIEKAIWLAGKRDAVPIKGKDDNNVYYSTTSGDTLTSPILRTKLDWYWAAGPTVNSSTGKGYVFGTGIRYDDANGSNNGFAVAKATGENARYNIVYADTVDGQSAYWNQDDSNNEPNNMGDEYYLEMYYNKANWNDLDDNHDIAATTTAYTQGENGNYTQVTDLSTYGPTRICGYVVEYGDEVIGDSDEKYYIISLEANEGTYKTGYTPPKVKRDDIKVVLPTAAEISKTGYTFGGWYDNAQFSGRPVTELPATVASGENGTTKTYYAKWTANEYTVEAYTAVGSVTEDQKKYTYGGSETLPTLTDTDGYHFEGWYTDADLTSAGNINTNIADNSQKFYAKWTKEVEATVMWDDGDDRDGLRDDEAFKVTLSNNAGLSTETIAAGTTSNDVTVDFGQRLAYTYAENGTATAVVYEVTGSEKAAYEHAQSGFAFTLSRTPVQKKFTVRLNWLQDTEDYRPDSVTATLVETDGTTDSATIILPDGEEWEDDLTANGGWSSSANLFAKRDGTAAKYRISMTAPAGYEFVGTDAENNEVVSANINEVITIGDTDVELLYTLRQTKTTLSGTITWKDESNQDGKRPTDADSVAALLSIADRTGITLPSTPSLTVTPGADNEWDYQFSGLPSHNGSGNPAEYQVTADDYKLNGAVLYAASVADDKKSVTMTYGVSLIDLTVNVVFSDADSQTPAPRPASVTATVNGSDSDTVSFELDSSKSWSHTEKEPRYKTATPVNYQAGTELVIADYSGNNASKGYSYSAAVMKDSYHDENGDKTNPDNLSGRTFTYTLTPKTFTLTLDSTYDPTPDDAENNDTVTAENFPTEVSYTYGAQNEIPIPTVPGVTFTGWAYDHDNDPNTADQMFTPDENGKIVIPAEMVGDFALKAVYGEVEYEIVYVLVDSAASAGTNSPATYEYYEAPMIDDPTHATYAFGGWYSDLTYTKQIGGRDSDTGKWTFSPEQVLKDGLVKTVVDEASQVTKQVITLYARWTKSMGTYTASWDDQNNQDEVREDVPVRLYQQIPADASIPGSERSWDPVNSFTLPANLGEGQRTDPFTFTGITVHDANGDEIQYKVEPDLTSINSVKNEFGEPKYEFKTMPEQNGNTHFTIARTIYKKIFTVKILWDDKDNKWNTRPESLEAELTADGKFDEPPKAQPQSRMRSAEPEPGVTVQPTTAATLSAASGWSASWWAQVNDEPETIAELKYDVKLLTMPSEGYVMSETVNPENTEKVITFTLRTLLLPPTGDDSSLALWGGLLALCAGGLSLLAVKRRKSKA